MAIENLVLVIVGIGLTALILGIDCLERRHPTVDHDLPETSALPPSHAA